MDPQLQELLDKKACEEVLMRYGRTQDWLDEPGQGSCFWPDADVDYTFGQVAVDAAAVEYGANCGNMSSAIGPFAVDEGLVAAGDGEVTVRIHNTNTGKLILSRFTVENGRA